MKQAALDFGGPVKHELEVTGKLLRTATPMIEVRCPLCGDRHVHHGAGGEYKPHCVSPKSGVRYWVVAA